MTEFESRLWSRQHRVDDSGISESQWDGSLLRFIPWDQLDRVDFGSLRSSFGERIKPRLDDDKKRCLMGTVLAAWRDRAPPATMLMCGQAPAISPMPPDHLR